MTLRQELDRVLVLQPPISHTRISDHTTYDLLAGEFLRDHGPALLEAVRDAERYRWLREESSGQFEHPIAVSQRRQGDTMVYIGPLVGDDLDQAIDAAREGYEG